MSFVNRNRMLLLSRQNFSNADCEDAFRGIVQVIGGTYYTSGVATGPVNGLLDTRNFAPNAGIANVNKAAPYAWVVAGPDSASFGTVNAGQSQTFNIPLPWDIPGIWPANYTQTAGAAGTGVYLVGITACCQTISSATNQGSAGISFTSSGGGSSGLSVPWTNVATTSNAILVNSNNWLTPTSYPITMGTSMTATFTATTANYTNPVVQFWFKMMHLKGM